MRKTKISDHPNVDTDVADYDDHHIESLLVGRPKSGRISLGPDELACKHKIRLNLKVGTNNTRFGVPRDLEGWMKTTLYRDNTTLHWIVFEDRVALRPQRHLPGGVDRCVCKLQPARTTTDGGSYMASCRIVMNQGQRRDLESCVRQVEQDDRFSNGVITAQRCDILFHGGDIESNDSSDIMDVSDTELLSKTWSLYIVTSHSLQPAIIDIRQHLVYCACFTGNLLPLEG